MTTDHQSTHPSPSHPNLCEAPGAQMPSQRSRSALAKLAMIGVAATTLSALTGMGVAEATTAGPTVHEQQNLNQNVVIATANAHTTIVTSPVLKPGSYLVNLIINVDSDQPGATVLCGNATTASGDIVTGNYGVVDNQGTTAPVSGTCEVTGTVTITQTNDHVTGWATVFSGAGGADAFGWSMNETTIGNLTVTH